MSVCDLLRRAFSVGALAGTLSLGFAGAAVAAGSPVKVGTPVSSGPPAVAVGSSGDAIVVWANTQNPNQNFVQYCVLPLPAKACAHSGSLVPAGNEQAIDGTQVLVDGSTIVILADVYGSTAIAPQDYRPEQEWQSTDGGATFTIVDGGLSVADGIINADTGPLSAVIMPGTGFLGFGWDTALGPETFNAFPLSSPPECSVKSCPAGFARLEPMSNPNQIGNSGGEFAVQGGSAPGVLGVFPTLFSSGPFACPGSDPTGMAFAYGSGTQSASNNYNVDPGQANSAWRVPATQGACGVAYLAVDGGRGGFGVLAENEANTTTVYERFNQGKLTFAGMTPARVSKQGERSPAVTQDASGSVYATYLSGGLGGPVTFSYGPNGGTAWLGPVTLDRFAGQSQLTSSVNATGSAWAAWSQNGSIYAQRFSALDAIALPVLKSSGSSNGRTITIKAGCVQVPCKVTVTITSTAKHKPPVLAKHTFTLHKAGFQKLTLKLTRAGKRYMTSHPGTVKLKVKVAGTIYGLTRTLTKTVKVTRSAKPAGDVRSGRWAATIAKLQRLPAPRYLIILVGKGRATVRFLPLRTPRGGPGIKYYTATASPGGRHVSRHLPPITIAGLTSGVSYTFTVTATNKAGTGPPTKPSPPVTVR